MKLELLTLAFETQMKIDTSMSSKFQILISKTQYARLQVVIFKCKTTSKNMNLDFLKIGHQSHTYNFGDQNWKHFGLWSLTKLRTLLQINNISLASNCHYVKMVAHYPITSAHKLQPQQSNPSLVII